MGTIWMPGGSGGADTSVVTATAEDVLAPKVIVGPDGEPITGTMVNNGAVSHSLPINGTYPIPKGYHDGNGKVSQSIPVQGGSTTTPGTVAKTIVTANRYVTGNIVVAGSANLVPANIKKGVNIFGVVGTHSGYVPSATDLYIRGNNPANFSIVSGALLDSGQITITDRLNVSIKSKNMVNFSGFSMLNIEGYSVTKVYGQSIYLFRNNVTNYIASVSWGPEIGNFTKSLNISSLQFNDIISFKFEGIGLSAEHPGAIYRIWLS